MILQALTEYYQTLAARGEIAAPGWSPAQISFALCIGGGGELEQVISIQTEQIRGKKTVLAPQLLTLPAPEKRSSGVRSNFLWDHSGYLLGIDEKGDPQRALACFAACRAHHEALLDGVATPAAQALLAFFRSWRPESGREHPALAEHLEDILSGANLVFRYGGAYVSADPAIRQAWDLHYGAAGEGPELVCLVTGERGPAEKVHPSIKNVQGAQSSGAALVSFNAPAFCSYGREQNLNAPVGKFAAFAYTAALNHLLADRDHVCRVGDAAVVCWARGGGGAYQALFGGAFFGASLPSYSPGDIRAMVDKLCRGESVLYDQTRLDPNMEFYILGLSPNAARLSVRFFLRSTFGDFLKNAQAHQQRLEIARAPGDRFETLPLWKLLDETVNQKSRDKSPAPQLAGETLRAILSNAPYPAALLSGATLRIRAERSVTRGRAAIIKAYYTKRSEQLHRELPDVPREVLSVSLNPDSTNIPYTLGRLFSVLEAVQSAANPGINAAIRDRYFNSAAATPATVFPILVSLSQKHLKKLRSSNRGLSGFYEKQLAGLSDILGETYPTRLSLPQQGSFQLGYYHQTAARYQKKEEIEHV